MTSDGITLSLANQYVNDLKDVVAASRWLEIAAAHIEDRDEESHAEYQFIQERTVEAPKLTRTWNPDRT